MTDRFIDNFTPGDGTDGLTWAKAELTAAAVDAADAAGDRWLFDSRHSESTAGTLTLAVAGTTASPSQLLSVTQSGASGASALTAGATIATSSTGALSLSGVFYAYGLTISCGTGGSVATFTIVSGDGSSQIYDTCTLTCGTTSTNQRLTIGVSSATSEGYLELRNCTLKFNATGQGLNILSATVKILGGSIDAAGSDITTFIATATSGVKDLEVSGFDFTNAAASINMVAASATGTGRYVFRNCKMPASWSGGAFAGAPTMPGARVEMFNCDSGDTNYRLWIEDYAGSIKNETTLVKTGGASDGTTPISWKVATSANAEYPTIHLVSPEIAKWNETTGSSVTVTVDILHDSATALKDNEVWLEVEYLGTSGTPLSLFADDATADVLATAADQTSSSATWTTTGMANPNKQKLSVTFTPQEKGLIIAHVCAAKASYTLYVDPELQVS